MTSSRAPEWTREEFAVLLSSPTLSDEAVGGEVQRSAGAVAVVRQGVHLLLQSEPTHNMLSRMMIAYLEPRREHMPCAVCLGNSGGPAL
jgi:hypothetical protein